MKKIKNGKLLVSIGAALLFMITLIFSIGTGGGIFDLKKDGELSSSDKITASADSTPSNITYPVANDLGRFVDGYQYLCTDKGLMSSVHTGAATDDMKTVVVDSKKDATASGSTWGSETDPYVIASAADWETFVIKIARDSKHGSGKVFVLAKDIDFSTLPTGSVFHMAAFFQGTFYGLGHTLKNISCSDWTYFNTTNSKYETVSNQTGGGFGTFGKLQDAVVADLIVENFSFTNVQQAKALDYWYGSGIGGISGVSYGTTYVLNCQTSGFIEHQTFTGNNHFGWPAGIVGCNTGTLYIYRCSSELSVVAAVSNSFHPCAAGIVAEVYGTAFIYDCAANLKTTIKCTSSTSQYSHIGACVGWVNGRSNIENFVGTVETEPDTIATPNSGSLGGSNNDDLHKNIYVDGKQGATGSTSKPNLVPWCGSGSFNNLNDVKSGNYRGNATNTLATNYATRDALLDAAKKAVGTTPTTSKLIISASIWDAEKIKSTDYTPKNSPVRHEMRTLVKYFNLTSTSEDQYSVEGKTDAIEVKAGQNLYVPENLDANREFLGWTTDKKLTADKVTANNPFKTVPFDLLGENYLYAVWGPKNATLNIIPTGNGMQTEASGAKSLVYNGDGSSSGITLAAQPYVTGMSDPKYEYQWVNEDGDITVGGTGDSYQVKNVRDSGKYWVKVIYHSQREPLYFGTLTCLEADKIEVLIKPAPLTCTSVGFKPDKEEDGKKIPGEHAYSGASYTTATPIAIVTNAKGETITGTAEWASKVGRFNTEGSVTEERDGKVYEKSSIIFKPDASHGGNYGESITFNEVEFEVEFLTFTFYIPDYYDKKLSFKLTYGDSYSYERIASEFETLFADYTSDKQLIGYSPAFVMDEDDEENSTLKINDYRALNFGGVTTAYSKVTEDCDLKVKFIYQTYTVNYDARNGSSGYYRTDKEVGHNMHLESPVDPTNGSKMFLGWYQDVTVEGETQPVSKQWDFTKDCVTRNLTLYAKWLDADEFAGLTVDFTNDAQFNALEEVNPSYLIVKATFKGTDEETGKKVSRETILSCGGANGYTITYSKLDCILHVTSTENNQKTDTITISYSYSMKGSSHIATVTKTLTVQPKQIDTKTILGPYFKPSTAVYQEGQAQSIKINTNVHNKISQINDEEIVYRYLDEKGDPIDASQVIDKQKYTVFADFKVSDDYEAPSLKTTFEIIPQPITLKVDWGETTFTYNGKVQVPTPTFTDPEGHVVDPNYHLVDKNGLSIDDAGHAVDLVATDANASGKYYTVSIEFDDHGYTVELNEKSVQFQILKATFKVPTQILAFNYRGEDYDLNALEATDYETHFSGFDPAIMEAYLGDKTAVDAGTYSATIRLKNPTCAEWESGGSGEIDLTWEIKKAVLRVSWDGSNEFIFTGSPQGPKVNSLYTIYQRDKDAVDLENDLIITGDRSVSEVGEYKITVALRSDVQWTKNYELNDTRSRSFSIVPDGVTIVYVTWDTATTLLEYNGAPQRPKYVLTIGTEHGEDVTEEVSGFINFNDEAKSSKYAGEYTAQVSLNNAGKGSYFLIGKLSCPYSIITNKTTGEGEAPTDSTPGGSDNSGGNTGDPGREDTNDLPLWQLIVTGVSAVLLVVCAAKAFSNYSKAKAAKKEAKELASTSYAVGYGFAPLPLLAIEFLGLGETPWTVIACVTLGLFLIAFAAMLLLGKKRKAAELLLRREQARIAEEKEYAREEEQQRRDNELKMMFAAMQQGYGQPREDMRSLLAETVSALLPAMQQMQALPPAQSDPSVYGAQNAYSAPQPNYGAQPDYGTPNYGTPNYGAPQNSEAEALRAQMAAQEERMARQQEQMAAQMAQQQELINKLLQNQGQPSAASYEEETVTDDISWLGENDEVVSLEDSYGSLSDDAKRCYYEIGSYIMGKPRTSQNDGKYAVLFKYRGKTLFKLCIKDDAPVLYYASDDGGKSEVRIEDSSTLSAAKGVVDLQIMKTDSQMS